MNPRQTRTMGQALGFFLGFGIVLAFGFLGDRPSRVSDPKGEGMFANAGQWASAVFYALGSVYALTTYGPVGLLALAFAVLIVARRLSASHGVPYAASHLLMDIRTVLLGNRVIRYVALGSIGLAIAFGVLFMFKLPTNGLAALASIIAWVTWLFIAGLASRANMSEAAAEVATRAETITLLTKAFSTSAAEWEASTIQREVDRITVTPPPIQAVLHYGQADAILALVAPGLELSASSDHECLVLVGASDATLSRREMEARTGGLIAGQVESGSETSPALAMAPISISADDLV